MGRAATRAAVVVTALLLGACTTDAGRDARGPTTAPAGPDPGAGSPGSPSAPGTPGSPGPSPSPSGPAPTSPSEPPFPEPPGEVETPARFDTAAAMSDVRHLADRIGPRLATSPAYGRAARFVETRLRDLGYDVRREGFPVPAGDSWGVPVEAGRSSNVIAEPVDLDPSRPHLVIGAHLDTVAVAPGAEDNASGVAVLLELARLAAARPTRLPVVFIAFGAEEPRGPGDDLHHFGSQHHVRELAPRRREALSAMVSLDRVGVGSVVPVCTGPLSPPAVQRQLLRAAARVDVPALGCENVASDHWSFEKEGFVVGRLGSTPYPAYHSADDLPRVIDQHQLGRTGRVVWEWLR